MKAIDAAHLSALASLSGVGPARLRMLTDAWEPAEAWRHIRRGTISSDASVAEGLGSRLHDLSGRWRAQASEIDPDALLEQHRRLGITTLGP